MSRHPQYDANAVQLSDWLEDSAQSMDSSLDGSLGSLLQRARWLLQLQRLLQSVVDPDLAERFQVANLRQGRLILVTPSAAWATRLRMQASSLIATLHDAGIDNLRAVEVRVSPLAEQPRVHRRERRLSAAAVTALDQMARLGGRDPD